MLREVPTRLKHQPIYAINDYHVFDGDCSDVQGLSLGKVQWHERGFMPSVKVWRKVNGRWSRQSEETTLTRSLDMAALIIKVLDKHYNNTTFTPLNKAPGCSLEIQEVNPQNKNRPKNKNDLMDRLEEYLTNPTNKANINAHVDMLYEALQSYMKKRP